MRMRDNVMIRYVPGGMDQFVSIYHPNNVRVLSEARSWPGKARSVTVWDNCDSFRFTIAPWVSAEALAAMALWCASVAQTLRCTDSALLRTVWLLRRDPFRSHQSLSLAKPLH